MKYKYFSQELLDRKDVLDLSNVFTEQQLLAQDTLNVSYGLMDIVLYLKDVTKDFTYVDLKYVDLDSAIRSIVSKYYNKKGEKNPFSKEDMALSGFEEGQPPREAVEVKDGKMKGKGIGKIVTKTKLPEPEPQPEPAKATGTMTFDEAMELIELLGDDLSEEQKAKIIEALES
jgi:hypothetical protein